MGRAERGSSESKSLELRHWRRLLLLIVGLALALRVVLVWQDTPMVLGGDEGEYVALGQTLARTGRFQTAPVWQPLWSGGKVGQQTAYRNVVLPGFLAMHYAALGPSQIPPRLSMAVVGALSCLLLGILGRQVFSPGVGLWAAGLWAIWPPSIIGDYAANRFTPEHLALALLLGHLVALTSLFPHPQPQLQEYLGPQLDNRSRIWPAVVGGLLLGLAILTRGYLVFVLPLSFLVLLKFLGHARWRQSLAFAAASVVVVGAWVARNAVAVGRPVLSTQTEALYLGNNRWTRGSLNGDVFELGARSPQITPLTRKYPDYWRMSEVERSQMWLREGKEAVLSDPRRAVWLAVRKTLIYLSPLQVWAVGFYKHHYAYALALLLVPWGLAAFWHAGRHHLWLLLAPCVASYAAVLLTYGLDRYRYPIEPIVVLLACAGAARLLRRASVEANSTAAAAA